MEMMDFVMGPLMVYTGQTRPRSSARERLIFFLILESLGS